MLGSVFDSAVYRLTVMVKKITLFLGSTVLALFLVQALNQGVAQKTKTGVHFDGNAFNRALGKAAAPFEQSFRDLTPRKTP